MKKSKLAAVVWLCAIGALLVYELWSVLNSSPGDTLSEAVWKYGQHPMVGLAVGVLIGHFFWRGKACPTCGENHHEA